jgi:type I restriction enzyme R subunit
MARSLAVWFHRSFGKAPNFKAGPFIPPPDPQQAEAAVEEELNRLREQNSQYESDAQQAQQAVATAEELRQHAERQAEEAYSELATALELAEETEAQAAASVQEYEERLATLQSETVATPAEEIEEVVQQAYEAGGELDLDEADTRRIIDAQLRDAGWEVDTQELTYRKGVRPQKGKDLAIAEWPTANGPADYVLFQGLTPLGIVEAKRQSRNVSGSIEQSKRYSRGYKIESDQKAPGGPWEEFKIPFLFATNGRSYLRQIATMSGIWFLDGRLPTNHARPLDGWYSPTGLRQLLKQDIPAADEDLREQSADYLPLRDYQRDAVQAVEAGVAAGRRQMLLAEISDAIWQVAA